MTIHYYTPTTQPLTNTADKSAFIQAKLNNLPFYHTLEIRTTYTASLKCPGKMTDTFLLIFEVLRATLENGREFSGNLRAEAALMIMKNYKKQWGNFNIKTRLPST